MTTSRQFGTTAEDEMKQALRVFALALWAVAAALPQSRIVQTRVYASHPQVGFYVDGVYTTGSAVYLWPEGSKHVLFCPPSQVFAPTGPAGGNSDNRGIDTRLTLSGWQDNLGTLYGGQEITIIAKAGITAYQVQATVEYRVMLRVWTCGPANGSACDRLDPRQPGYVYANGATVFTDRELWLADGSSLSLQAVPRPGFVFLDWNYQFGSNIGYQVQLPVRSPFSVQTRFSPAKRLSITTYPPELALKVLVDRTPVLPPITVDFAPGTTHVLGAESPQIDINGRAWVFSGFSNGQGNHTEYRAGMDANVPDSVQANFSPAARINFSTDPPGLTLKINGRENWPSYNFIGAVGASYDVSAAAEQTDSSGRKWIFAGWSNGGSASQRVTLDESATIDAKLLVARYTGTRRLTLQTNPPGLPLQVDGVECRQPCVVARQSGVTARISAPQTVPTGDDTRLEFVSWSDGGANTRDLAIPGADVTLVANYQTCYRVRAVAEPIASADVRMEPASPDGYYPAQTPVLLMAEPRSGYRFRRWDGDVASTSRTLMSTVTGPMTVRAFLERAPYLTPSGVRNAAGETPEAAVAPGSIITVVGAGLAATSETGPADPLAQTLAGVTVRLGERLLPLFAVTPEQITAYLPADAGEGALRLVVSATGFPDVATDFTSQRNAPGLFATPDTEVAYALATHEDGTPVDSKSPAKRGETVTLLGTGFGPLQRPVVEGFPVPSRGTYPLTDAVEVLSGDVSLPSAGAAAVPGTVGVAGIRVLIDEKNFSSGNIPLRTRVNGHVSNTVVLPVE